MANVIRPKPYRDEYGQSDRWVTIHELYKKSAKRLNPEIIFMGDCFFKNKKDLSYMDKYFSHFNCMHFAIREDRILNLLWRIKNGELKYAKPKILVLYIGRNDIKLSSVGLVTNGIKQCIRMIREKLPATHIIVPSFLSKTNRGVKDRLNDAAINSNLERYIDTMEGVSFVDINIQRYSTYRNGSIKVARDYVVLQQKIVSILSEDNIQ